MDYFESEIAELKCFALNINTKSWLTSQFQQITTPKKRVSHF